MSEQRDVQIGRAIMDGIFLGFFGELPSHRRVAESDPCLACGAPDGPCDNCVAEARGLTAGDEVDDK